MADLRRRFSVVGNISRNFPEEMLLTTRDAYTMIILRKQIAITLAQALTLVVLAAAPSTITAQTAERFYYWVTPQLAHRLDAKESFVIEVSAAQAAEIDAIRDQGGVAGFGGQIAAGSVSYNKNYYAPHQPVWNWHVESIGGIFDFRTTVFPACMCPYLIANPSEIAVNPEEWIRVNGHNYTPIGYVIQKRIDPNKRDAVANVSNRGMTGAGEKTLITGLIVTGGEPRNIVVRALGPSLTSQGIQQAAANPKIEFYSSSTRIASNADWRTDPQASVLSANYPTLVPGNEREAAIFLTLLPGAYTLHGISEDETEGVMLLEAYDVDAASQ